ncbi:probable vacuolar amino acid transporter YPQ1 [Phoenix dactylifera]|uniref:Probable vacuolar amino acid transporter YPQ1 n=1 Tax=Phoenix dactylifera TaxID=42345 RepID=A0A8B7C2C5_PHODC|nr:probable vacuolar amino acid transporter YPQ1 [Phoenix dactylifera]
MAKSPAWASCAEEKKACVGWIEKYFKDCVCSLSGEISFGLGLISLICWGIAEIPQIVTNFQTKSCHGVSLGLILTWVIGDIFNLAGCLLEPVTLPTQFYTALLYTATTVVLLLQTLYYDYWLRWWKSKVVESIVEVEEERKPLNPKLDDDSSRPIPTTASDRASPRIDLYYRSARSLASSGTPPYGSSYLGTARSGPSGSALHDSSSEDEASPAHDSRHRVAAKPKQIVSRSVGYGAIIIGSTGLPFQSRAMMEKYMGLAGRRILLQEERVKTLDGSPYGLLLGWIMAAIYMGGRLPQIYLNIKRGSVEGLNPLMFMFALIANATYVGSILVRSVEWERIKANAPWLLDAIICVLLDLFIMIQFTYYKCMHRRESHEEDGCGDYVEVKSPLPES